MSTTDTIERQDERRERRIAFLLATLFFVVSVLIGWSRLAGDDPATTDVLGEVFTARSGSNSGQSTPGQGQANDPGNGQPAPSGGGAGNPGTGNGPPTFPGTNPRTFGISGNLEEIYPTFDGPLEVLFTNPHRFEIVVTELDVELIAPSGGCADELSSDVFTIDDALPVDGVPLSPKRGNTDGTGSVDIDFYVSNDLPDECQGMSFELDYTGTAIRANQQ